MVYTNGRAAGNSAVRGPWPARIKPLENESLSSWLARASLANHSTPSNITNYIWPGWRAWTRDIDRELSKSQIASLSLVSTLTPEEIQNLTLRPIIQRITGKTELNTATAWKWVIQRSTRNKNTNRSTQFCPLCLQTNSKPYLRLDWRLSFITVCPKHNVNLLDACPHCGESIEIHKINRGKLSSCAHCRWNIADMTPVAANREVLSLTEQLIDDMHLAKSDKFELLAFVTALVRRLPKFQDKIIDPFLMNVTKNAAKARVDEFLGISFDWLNSDDRRLLLTAAAPLMNIQPKGLAFILLNSGLSIGLLRNMVPNVPALLEPYFPEGNPTQRSPPRHSKQSIPKPTPKRLVQKRWHAFLKKHGLS